MATRSSLEATSALLRARLRADPLPPGFADEIAAAAKRDIAWVRTASRHRIGPALGACLRDLGLGDALPPDLGAYFETMRAGNGEQNACFLEELAEITEALNALGFEPCLLKGAAMLVSDLYPDMSWRFMNDIDLLLPAEQVKPAWNRLRALGYQVYEGVIDGKEHHHEKALWHPEKLAYVELHHQVARPRYSRILPADGQAGIPGHPQRNVPARGADRRHCGGRYRPAA